jgi:hypothetical protein
MVREAALRAAVELPPKLSKAAKQIERDAASLQRKTKGPMSRLSKNKISVEIMRLERESSRIAKESRQMCRPGGRK